MAVPDRANSIHPTLSLTWATIAVAGVAAFQEVKGVVAVETGYRTPGKTATAFVVVLILQVPCKGQRSGCGKGLVVDWLPLGTPVSLEASCFSG